MNLAVRPAVGPDLGVVDALYRAAWDDVADAQGYPRCRDASEYVAELATYGLALGDSSYVVCDGPVEIGFFGLLYDPGGDAILAGPILRGASRHLMADALSLAEEVVAERFVRARATVAVSNEALTDALTDAGWSLGSLDILMERVLMPDDRVVPAAEIHEVHDPASEVWRKAVDLLGTYFKLDEDLGFYQLLVSTDGDDVLGAALWYEVKDTTHAVLEHLVVAEQARRRGVASDLVREILFRASVAGWLRVYLSVGVDNDPAIALYRRHGFSETVRRRTFSRSFGEKGA